MAAHWHDELKLSENKSLNRARAMAFPATEIEMVDFAGGVCV